VVVAWGDKQIMSLTAVVQIFHAFLLHLARHPSKKKKKKKNGGEILLFITQQYTKYRCVGGFFENETKHH
jgi:hypothetical protein